MTKSISPASRITIGLFLLSLTLYGCSSVPSKERWLTPTPKKPPQPEERVLGQAPAWNDYSSATATPVPNTHPVPAPTTIPAHSTVPPTPVSAPSAPAVADPWGGVGNSQPTPIQVPPMAAQAAPVQAAPMVAQAVPMAMPQQGMIAQPLPNNIPPQYPPQSGAIPPGSPYQPPGPMNPGSIPQLPTSPDQWANGATPMLPEPQLDDPWGLDSKTPVRQAVSIETAAQKEEEERERARLTELAKTKTKKADDKSSYLDPLDDPAGPFADRVQKTDTERDLVRQASYVEVSQKKYDNFPVYDWEKEEKKGFDWEMLDPVNFFTKVRDWVGLGPDEKKAIAAMKKGREIIDPISRDLSDKQKCLAAAKEFWTAAWRWPDSVLEEDALHLAGECYYFAGDYPNAMKCYQKLIIKYQHSPHLDTDVRRLFAIGRYWEKEALRGVSSINMSEKSRPTFDTFGWAKKAYETIFINDPNGPISDDAVMALAEAYLKRGKYQGDDNYDQAAYYFKYLRENFPLSKHVAKAHELELHSRTSAYMGAEYNSKTLDEAGKLAEVTLRQFGNELGEDKDEVVAIKEGVVQRQAEREWVLGQHYDKKKYYGSARIYYEKLIDQYPQTAYAEKARKRLDEISDKPAQPSKFEFIQKAFTAR